MLARISGRLLAVAILLLTATAVAPMQKSFSDLVQSAFGRCDLDRSGSLTREEFDTCILRQLHQDVENPLGDHIPLQESDSNMQNLFRLVDRDQDGQVSVAEYAKLFGSLMDPKRANDPIEVTTRDGSTQTITPRELYERMREQTKGFRMENDRILRDEEKSERLEDIEKQNPGLARIIHMGKWALKQLQKYGHAMGKLNRIRSLSDEDKPAQTHRPDSAMILWLEIKVKDAQGIQTVHVRAEFNPSKYRSEPHFGLLQAQQVLPDGQKVALLIPADLAQSSPASTAPNRSKPAPTAASKQLDFIHQWLRGVVDWVAPRLGISLQKQPAHISSLLSVLVMSGVLILFSFILALVVTLLYNLCALFAGDIAEEDSVPSPSPRSPPPKISPKVKVDKKHQ